METLIITPTYCEVDNLERLAARILSLDCGSIQLLIIDDNSPDGTGEVADDLRRRYPDRMSVIHRPGKKGLGTAYVLGFRYALQNSVDVVIQMDADFSHSPEYVPVMLNRIRDYDVVIGSRYVDGGGIDERWDLKRRLLSRGGNLYARLVTGLRVRDATGGFKCFRREVLANLDLDEIRSDGYAFQVEVAYACQQKGYRICEIPIFFEERDLGSSKMSLPIVLEAIWRVWDIRRRY